MDDFRAATTPAAREPVLDVSGLLASKLRAPMRRHLVHRPRLVERLAGVSDHALTVLSASAGWGKTSLLSDWHQTGDGVAARGRVGWLSLDPQDDPHRFWTFVVAALRTVVPELGERALRMLNSPSRALTEAVLPSLINELLTVDEPLVLVLDDYHVITNPEVHSSVDYLLRRGAPAVHLLIAGRIDPPLSTGRLRAAGELLETRPTRGGGPLAVRGGPREHRRAAAGR